MPVVRLCAVMLFPVMLGLPSSCKSPASSAPDAGTPVERGTDLRSSLTTLFPEYRGVQLTAGRAAMTRTSGPATQADLDKALEAAKQSGFSGDPPTRAPFVMEQRLEGNTLHQEVRLPLSEEELSRILSAPSAMSTEALAHWMPKVAPKLHEEFDFEIVWMAKDDARADFLLWQVADGARINGWQYETVPSGFQLERVDGGRIQASNEFSVTLRNAQLGSVIDIDRKRQHAKLRYRLVTFERR